MEGALTNKRRCNEVGRPLRVLWANSQSLVCHKSQLAQPKLTTTLDGAAKREFWFSIPIILCADCYPIHLSHTSQGWVALCFFHDRL